MGDLYPYARGALLDQRNSYFYTEYHGRAFLPAWRADRDLARAPQTERPDPILHRLAPDGAAVETADLLEALLADLLACNAVSPDAAPWIDKLVKKFETTKRIHGAYDEAFRARDKTDFRSLGLYLRLAEVFEAAYAIEPRLPVLNALLKCLDTLCAYRDCFDEKGKGRLSRLVARERGHVEKLAADT